MYTRAGDTWETVMSATHKTVSEPKAMRGEPEDPTGAEIRALRALVEHGTVAEAAASLGISRHTVDTQLDRLRRKTGMRKLPQLIGWAARGGWLEDG
jgi:DNA-binding CsgD family transcriptional regulator